MPATDEFYRGYSEYKGWSAEALPVAAGTFENILQIAAKAGQLRILEIGFGDGAFLDWARENGHTVVGSEIRAEAVAAAQARGHEAYLGMPDTDPFDLIVGIDVLEHLSGETLLDFFRDADRLLKPEGRIVARFPNGSSPFFGHFQHGDYTHGRPISPTLVKQVALLRGFDLVRAVNPRPRAAGLTRRLKTSLAYLTRDLIELVIGYAYFGCRLPMDPNVVVVLERKEGQGSAR